MTTNRVTRIDSAFKSRIHLSLYYPELSSEARRSIWKTFIAKSRSSDTINWLNEDLLTRLSAYDINGRQIKNITRMACSIAANEQRTLQSNDLFGGLEALTSFEADFGVPAYAKRHNVSMSFVESVRSSFRIAFSPGWTHIAIVMAATNLATRSVWKGVTGLMRWQRSSRS